MSFSLRDMPAQDGRVALITGASSGLGREAARALAARGAKVLMACRDVEKGLRVRQQLQGDLEVLPLDLASLASVRALAARLIERGVALDLLINNAGVMATPLTRTEDGFELQLGTNHLGHFSLTAQLMPLLVRQRGARVVTVSSLMHKRGTIDFDNLDAGRRYRPWRAYAQSKLANLLFCYELDRRLRASRAAAISVAAHPGWTRTQLTRRIPGADLAGAVAAMTPAQGVLPTLMAATHAASSGGDYFGPTGPWEVWGPPGKVASSPLSRDEALARRLWEVSEELTGVRFTC